MDIQIVKLFLISLRKGRNNKLMVREQRSRKEKEGVHREKGRDRNRHQEKAVKVVLTTKVLGSPQLGVGTVMGNWG